MYNKKLLLLLVITMFVTNSYAQNYDILTYALNGTPTNGVKIKTNLPFSDGSQMPTLILEGYNYGGASPIGLLLTYYIYNGSFISARLSSYGSFTPPVYLANEGGKVVIFIDSRDYFLRFTLKAFARDRPAETAINFQGWTTADEALLGTASAILQVPYQNQFSGKVGIGTSTPQAGIHITSVNTLPNGELAAAVLGNAYNHWTYFGSTNGGKIRGSNEGYLALETNSNGTNKNMYINLTSPGNILMATGGGNVGIGTLTPGSYKLAVEGTIGARKVKVTQAAWADYVFSKDYQLPSVELWAQYIQQHHHLPGVPTAEEVTKDGIDLGDMSKVLLEKIEELTLMLIKEHNHNKQLEEDVRSLKNSLDTTTKPVEKQ